MRWWSRSAALGLAIAFSLLFLPLFVATAGAATVAGARLQATGCVPQITSWSVFHVGPDPDVTIQGNCFGTGGAFTNTDSAAFRVSIFAPSTTRAQVIDFMTSAPGGVSSLWNACSNRTDAVDGMPDSVGCTVTNWSAGSITLTSFGSSYGGSWVVTAGERLAIEVWNANSLAGPAIAYATAGQPGGQSGGNSEVSSIAASLPTPAQAFSPITTDIANAVISVGLAVFITFPANLFNATFEENYERIATWWRTRFSRAVPDALRRRLRLWARRMIDAGAARARMAATATEERERSSGQSPSPEQWRFAGVILAGALLGSLLDPRWGPNFRSVLSFVSIAIAMVAGVAFSGLARNTYHRARGHGRVERTLESLPGGLAVAAVCVLISRGAGFSPGYLYGIVCGVAFSRDLAENEQGHVVALEAWGRVVLAFVAWFAWAAITQDATRPGSFFGIVLVDDFLASLFVSSLVSTVISLLPLRFLPGHKLRKWHQGAWLATFAVALFALVQILLRPHSTSSGPSHAPLVTTVVLFVLFGGGSVLFRRHFALQRRREEAGAAAGEPVVDITSLSPAAAGQPPLGTLVAIEVEETEVRPQL